jgi:hypothetical protein
MPDDVEAKNTDRSNWPIRVCRLGEDADDTLDTTPEQRLAMMWELVTQGWAIAGRATPTTTTPTPAFARSTSAIQKNDEPRRPSSRADVTAQRA